MRQEQERFGFRAESLDRGVDTNTPRRCIPIDTSGLLLSVKAVSRQNAEEGSQEIRFGIKKEEDKEERRKESSPTTDTRKFDGFEPFVNPNDPLKPPQTKEATLFVNLYGGSYAQNMQLNRKGVERALTIAHLDGQVFLSSLSPNRQRSIEANPDGSVSAKGSLMLGEKVEEDEKDNPLYRVVSIPQGWRIEVNEQKLTEELTDKKLSGKELQRAFAKRFNSQLREALKECVWREKLSSEKDKYLRLKLFTSLFGPALEALILTPVLLKNPSVLEALNYGWVFMGYAIINLLEERDRHRIKGYENLIREINPNFKSLASPYRKIDGKWEYFMPYVEIDKLARTYAYLEGKGRRLVREVK